MAHIHLSLPDDLAQKMLDKLPGLNVSAVLQETLRGLLGCDHEHLACAGCRASVDRRDLARDALAGFYRDLMWEVGDLVHEVGTAEGAARVLKRVGLAHGVTIAERLPLPRPSRAVRERAADRRWEEEDQPC